MQDEKQPDSREIAGGGTLIMRMNSTAGSTAPYGKEKTVVNSTPTANTNPPVAGPNVNPLRSLSGKLVFLDLSNSYKSLEQMKECLRLVGVSVAECFSKEVQVVISNRGKSVLNESNTNQNSIDFDKKQKTPPNSLLSRSRSLIRTHAILENASKSSASADVVSTAIRLGIKVMNVNELERYVDRYKKKSLDGGNVSINDDNSPGNNNNSKSFFGTRNTNSINNNENSNCLNGSLLKKDLNVYKLKAPYLKFESICKQYRPIYKEFREWHELNLDPELTRKTRSPFQMYCSDNGIISSSHHNDQSSSSSSESPPSKMLRQSSGGGKKMARKSSNNSTNTTKVLSQTPATTQPQASQQQQQHYQTQQQQQQQQQAAVVKRKNVFCECCRQRFDNIKQHLASSQHENFERNAANFKEIDEYVNGVLNFERFLESNGLKVTKTPEKKVNSPPPPLQPPPASSSSSLPQPARTSVVKGRRRNMSITYEAYETLREAFEKNQDPTDSEISQLASRIVTDPELLKKWFTKQRKKKLLDQEMINESVMGDGEQARSSFMKSEDEARSSSFTLTLMSSKLQATTTTPPPPVMTPTTTTTTARPVPSSQANRFNKLTPNRILANFLSQKFNRSSDLLRSGGGCGGQSPSCSSSMSLSSPSAALILGINNNNPNNSGGQENNSFSVPNQKQYSNAVKKRMSRSDALNTSSTANLHFSTPGKGNNNNNNTSASNIDELIVATFNATNDESFNNNSRGGFYYDDDVLYDTN